MESTEQSDLLDAAVFSARYLPLSAWTGHLPFAAWLIRQVRPKIFVELGAHTGCSYFAFCQAVQAYGLQAKCYAVDTWQGDKHAGFYGEDVFQCVSTISRESYGGFSWLLRMTFDQAIARFSDHSIDLLHIDGLHTYEAVKHDFQTWLPKLSAEAVVLLHDTNARDGDFGVWRFWEELQAQYPLNFEFHHSYGLGVLQIMASPTERQLPWLKIGSSKQRVLREYFAALGSVQIDRYELGKTRQVVSERDIRLNALEHSAAASEESIAALQRDLAERDHEITDLTSKLAQRDEAISSLHAAVEENCESMKRLRTEISDRNATVATLQRDLTERNYQITDFSSKLAQRDGTISSLHAAVEGNCGLIKRLQAELEGTRSFSIWKTGELEDELHKISHSISWRVTRPVREVERWVRRLRNFLDPIKVIRKKTRPIRYFLMRKPLPRVDALRQGQGGNIQQRQSGSLMELLKGIRKKTRPLRYFLTGKKLPPGGPRSTFPVTMDSAKAGLGVDPLDIDFDEPTYLSVNPDVARGVRDGTFRSAREHFIQHGINEIPTSQWRVFRFKLGNLWFDFDETAFLADNPDLRPHIAGGAYRNGWEYFLRTGYAECREGIRAIYGNNRFVRLVQQVDGTAPRSQNHRFLAMLSHYDRDGIIDDYVLAYLEALSKLGADICFITAVEDAKELEKVRKCVFSIIIKNDAGRDFGSWYLALKTLDPETLAAYDYVVFVNDSIYFPIAEPNEFFAWMQHSKLNLLGLTDSRALDIYHVQSYWLAFDRTAQSVVLPEFIRRFEAIPYMTKAGQITSFEMGLSKFAAEQGLTLGAYCSIDAIGEDVIGKQNLASWLPAVLMGGGRCKSYAWSLGSANSALRLPGDQNRTAT